VPAHDRGGSEPAPKEIAMYAVFGRVEIDSGRADEAVELLNNYTVPMVKQAPGFVSGTWALRGRNARTEPHPV
jgi:hypothetical protein